VLRRIFGPKRNEVTRDWKKLHNKELNDLYSSPNIFCVIKSRRKEWAGHVARMGESIGGWGNLRERDHLEDSGIGGMIILRCIFRKWEVRALTGLIWLRIGTAGGHF